MMVGVLLKKDVHVIMPRGQYDRKMAAELENKIYDLCGQGALKFVLDLKRVKGILSKGVHSLIEIYGRIRELGGDMKLAGLHRDVKFVLQFTELENAFSIHPTQADALASFGVNGQQTKAGTYAKPSLPAPGPAPVGSGSSATASSPSTGSDQLNTPIAPGPTPTAPKPTPIAPTPTPDPTQDALPSQMDDINISMDDVMAELANDIEQHESEANIGSALAGAPESAVSIAPTETPDPVDIGAALDDLVISPPDENADAPELDFTLNPEPQGIDADLNIEIKQQNTPPAPSAQTEEPYTEDFTSTEEAPMPEESSSKKQGGTSVSLNDLSDNNELADEILPGISNDHIEVPEELREENKKRSKAGTRKKRSKKSSKNGKTNQSGRKKERPSRNEPIEKKSGFLGLIFKLIIMVVLLLGGAIGGIALHANNKLPPNIIEMLQKMKVLPGAPEATTTEAPVAPKADE